MIDTQTRLQETADFLFSLGFEEKHDGRTFVKIDTKHNGRIRIQRIVLDDEGHAIEGRLPIYRVITRTWAQNKER